MNEYQELVVASYGILSVWVFYLGYVNAIRKGNVFGVTPQLLPLGVFVWGDAVIIGLFGAASSGLLYILQEWWLAVLVWSLFWVVRSLGELIYWLNQQFASVERNPPANLSGYRFFPNDSIWFVYQLSWQITLVISAVISIYAAYRWLSY